MPDRSFPPVVERGDAVFTEFFRPTRSAATGRSYLGAVGLSRPRQPGQAHGWAAYDQDGGELGRFRDRDEAVSAVLAGPEAAERATGPASTVDHADGAASTGLTPTRQPGGGTVTGPLVAAIESAWAAIQQRHADVPDVVLTLGGGSTRSGQVTFGHFHAGKWTTGDGQLPELFVGGEGLVRGPRALLGTLLHEATHGIAAARNIQETSRQGRYHNRRFRDLAAELGILVEQDPAIGWSITSVPDATAEQYRDEIAALDVALTAHRLADAHAAGRAAGNNGLVAVCGCDPPRKLRVSRAGWQAGPILCGVCETAFTTPDANTPGPAAGPTRQHAQTPTTEEDTMTEPDAKPDPNQLSWRDRIDRELHLDRNLAAQQRHTAQQEATRSDDVGIAHDDTVESLRRRADRVRAVLAAREAEHQQVATDALSQLHQAREPGVEIDEQASAEPAAGEHAATRIDRALEDRVLAEPVTDARIDAASTDETRRLLIETKAAQQAIGKLRDTHRDTARDAVGLWREYHEVHGYDEDSAESQAWLETSDGVRAVYENAYYDTDYRALARQHQPEGGVETATAPADDDASKTQADDREAGGQVEERDTGQEHPAAGEFDNTSDRDDVTTAAHNAILDRVQRTDDAEAGQEAAAQARAAATSPPLFLSLSHEEWRQLERWSETWERRQHDGSDAGDDAGDNLTRAERAVEALDRQAAGNEAAEDEQAGDGQRVEQEDARAEDLARWHHDRCDQDADGWSR